QAKSEGVLFPSLLWVLRDFHLRLVDARDRPITPQQYLENALAPIAGQEKRNEIRAVIKSVFTDRDCAAMVRPVLEEEDLRHVERLPFASLRPQFRKQASAARAAPGGRVHTEGVRCRPAEDDRRRGRQQDELSALRKGARRRGAARRLPAALRERGSAPGGRRVREGLGGQPRCRAPRGALRVGAPVGGSTA
ncbi:unnamed protein product, partial [Prorocentrum cordatum]